MPIAHKLEDLFDTRPDDAGELSFWQMREVVAILADLGDRDRFAVVQGRSQAGAVQRFQALGVGKRDVEPACQVHGDVATADGECVDMGQAAA